MFEKISFIMSKMWEFLKPFIKVLMSQAGQILADAAMSAVMVMADQNISNSEKREEAFKIIVEDLKKRGITVSSSIIYATIEAAVQKLKAATA